MKEKIRVLKNLLYYMAGSYMEYFIGLVISILIARSLTPSEYGNYAFLIWLSAMGVILINNGINTAVIKFLAEQRGKRNSEYNVFKYIRGIQLKFASFVISIIIVLSYGFHDYYFNEYDLMIVFLMIIAIFFRSMYMFYVSVSKGLEKFKYSALSILLVSPLNLLLVFFISRNIPTLDYFIYVYVFISILYCLSIYLLVKRGVINVSGSIDNILKNRILSHIKIVSFNVVLGFIIYKQSELIFLKWLATEELVAYYNVGFLLASSAMLLVPGIFSGLLLPLMSRAGTQKNGGIKDKFITSTRYLLFLSSPVAVIGIIISEILVELLYGPEYILSASVLKVCLVSCGIAIVGNAAQSYFLSTDNQKTVLKIYLITAFVNLTLDFILVSNFGLSGAYYANLFASFLLTYLLITSCRNELNALMEYGVYVKLIISSLLAAIPLLLTVSLLNSNLILVILSLIIFIPLYIVLSIIFNCWSNNDQLFIKYITGRILSKKIL